MLAGIAEETVLVTKMKTLDRSPRAFLRNALRFRIEATRHGSVTTLAVNPFLNYAQAMAAAMIQGELTGRPSWAKRQLVSILSLLGIARDLVLIPTFILVVLTRTRGTFDVCHVEGPWAGASGWALRALGRVRRVIYDDIDYVAGGQILRLRQAYVRALENAMIRRADLVISAGWMLGAYRREATGRDVLVIPNGVDADRFARARIRRPHPPTLVYVGHVADFAGVDLAVRAMARIRTLVKDARLVIVGDGDAPILTGLRKLAKAEGVDHVVEFRGKVPYDMVPAILAESDLGLATFRATPLGKYAFPLKILEYFAAGLPVLCAEGTEGAEILRRHPGGRAVPFDPEAMAIAAVELLTCTAKYAEASKRAVEAAEVFGWDRAMAAERDALSAILAPAPQPAPQKDA